MEREDAFVSFAAAALPGLQRLALSLTGGDASRADDAVQDALERVYLAWPKAEVRNPGAYTRTVLVRALVSDRRRAWWRREVSVSHASEPDSRPDLAAEAAQRMVLLDALAELPIRQRHTVVLRYLEDLPVSEVADLLGCSEGTVKRAAYDGLRNLRAALITTDVEGQV